MVNMGTRIHPTAVIDPRARIGRNVDVGPFCVIERDVVVGDDCLLAARVVLKQSTRLGCANEIAEGAVLGGKPQHLRHRDGFGQLVIGDRNIIRENTTLHLGLTPSCATVIGDDNLVMVNVHIAHDCQIGHHTIMANNVVMAGHVTIGNHAYLSGAVGIHQFCRIGAHAMVGGQAHVTKDVPPFVTVDGQTTRIVGLNLIGLRRRGFDNETIRELKAAYRTIYRRGLKWTEVLDVLRAEFPTGPAAEFLPFFLASQRGVLFERKTPAAVVVPVNPIESDTDAPAPAAKLRRFAG